MNLLRWLHRNDPRAGLRQEEVLDRIEEDLRTSIGRGRFMGDRLEPGVHSFLHAMVVRGDSGAYGKPGTAEDLGWSHNYRPDAGMDWLHRTMGGYIFAGTSNYGTTTSISATSLTDTGKTWTTDDLIGARVYMPVTGVTTQPVYGNILDNTGTVITIDQWNKYDDTAGTTPANGNAYVITNGCGPARFIGLTNEQASHPNEVGASTTTLTTEITTNGLARALATFAHTATQETYTLVKQWTATGSQSVHRAGNFTGGLSGGSVAGGVMVAGTCLNQDATLGVNDTLQVTWTWTLPNQGS